MNLWKSMAGTYTVELVSANWTHSSAVISRNGIMLENIRLIDPLTVCFSIPRRQYMLLQNVCERSGDKIRIISNKGLFWTVARLKKRMLLLVGSLIMVLSMFLLPTRVFFFEVEGNVSVATNQILEKASSCGLHFGASRRGVRSERVKNALLASVPELQWVGVNTRGCTAIITVRERNRSENTAHKNGVSRIVATRDGVIKQITVTQGNTLCTVGQAVQAGEILVSGYTDCGIRILAQRSQAEILAQTVREISVVTPSLASVRGIKTGSTAKYGLIIGKKRINFYNDSGNSDTSCVKIYEEKPWVLPGGFQLPVSFFCETWETYEMSEASIDMEVAQQQLQQFAQYYLGTEMIAGEIIGRQESVSCASDIYSLNGSYACLEMIGTEVNEEVIQSYE